MSGASDGLPPGPALSVSEQTARFLRTPAPFFGECRRSLGDAFTLELDELGALPVFSHPEIAWRILSDVRVFSAGRPRARWFEPVVGPCCVTLLDGDAHRTLRRQIAPLLSGTAVSRHATDFARSARRHADGWPRGRRTQLLPALHSLGVDLALPPILGPSGAIPGAIRDRFARWQATVVDERHAARRAILRGEIEAWFATRGRGEASASVLDHVLSHAPPAADSRAFDVVFDLVHNSIYALGLALAWSIHWLIQRPDVRHRLRRDLHPSRLVSFVKEALRMVPVAPFVVREAREDVRLGPWRIPRGATVAVCTYLIHRDPDRWNAPDRFDPDRFLDRPAPPRAYLPFGGGVRACLGQALAMTQITSSLSTLLSRIDLDGPTAPTQIRWHGTDFAPEGGVEVVLGDLGASRDP